MFLLKKLIPLFSVTLLSFTFSTAILKACDSEFQDSQKAPTIHSMQSWEELPGILETLKISVSDKILFALDFDDTLATRIANVIVEGEPQTLEIVTSPECERQNLDAGKHAFQSVGLTLNDYKRVFFKSNLFVKAFSPAEPCLFKTFKELSEQGAHLQIFSGLSEIDTRRTDFVEKLRTETKYPIKYTHSNGTKFRDMQLAASDKEVDHIIYIDNKFDRLPTALHENITLILYTGRSSLATSEAIAAELEIAKKLGWFSVFSSSRTLGFSSRFRASSLKSSTSSDDEDSYSSNSSIINTPTNSDDFSLDMTALVQSLEDAYADSPSDNSDDNTGKEKPPLMRSFSENLLNSDDTAFYDTESNQDVNSSSSH